MRGHLGGAAALLLFGLAVPAAADTVAPAKDGAPAPATGVAPAKEDGTPAKAAPAKETPPPELEESTSHRGMFLVSLQLPLGLRAIVPYDKTDYCGSKDDSTSTGNAPVCSGRAPFSIDLALGYGLQRRIDVFAEVRVGIEGDFASTNLARGTGPRQFFISPGARFFFSDAKHTKLFTTAQMVFDFAAYDDGGGKGRGADFGVRNVNGVWLDLDKAYGFYAFVGDTLTLRRWLEFSLEAGVGVQVRYR